MLTEAIEKFLSANDTGATGGHQAGILVPRTQAILSFFPSLDSSSKNPRAILNLVDETGRKWIFQFIYYNNKFFGGTRNEYRLTGMTAYFREFNLKAGDRILLHHESPQCLRIKSIRVRQQSSTIKLSAGWKVISTDALA